MTVKVIEDVGYASLNKCVIAPRKMRLVADTIRSKSVFYALTLLDCEQKKCAVYIKKLLLSAVTNYKTNCEKLKKTPLDKKDLFVTIITVDGDGMLKRLMPASQGRAFRKRRRSSNLFLLVSDSATPVVKAGKKIFERKNEKSKNSITNNILQK